MHRNEKITANKVVERDLEQKKAFLLKFNLSARTILCKNIAFERSFLLLAVQLTAHPLLGLNLLAKYCCKGGGGGFLL
jgi:hypothetical protein